MDLQLKSDHYSTIYVKTFAAKPKGKFFSNCLKTRLWAFFWQFFAKTGQIKKTQ